MTWTGEEGYGQAYPLVLNDKKLENKKITYLKTSSIDIILLKIEHETIGLIVNKRCKQ